MTRVGVTGLMSSRGCQFVAGRATTRWLWLIAARLLRRPAHQRVWFECATGEDLQPNIDDLSVDEVLLFGLLAGVASVLIARLPPPAWKVGPALTRQVQPKRRTP